MKTKTNLKKKKKKNVLRNREQEEVSAGLSVSLDPHWGIVLQQISNAAEFRRVNVYHTLEKYSKTHSEERPFL